MEIKDEHIKEVAKLLINGNEFDTIERVPFIKKLDSCDLLAVPGSGKTTALLAKLYCLSKQLPFKDGSGILVLSHTNAAINEIENKLKKVVPSLFEYPNFVGTIQSFVNKFLANPACFKKYSSYISQNDNDIYKREVEQFFNFLPWGAKKDKMLKRELYGRANRNKKTKTSKESYDNTIEFIQNLKFDLLIQKIIYGNKDSTLYTASGNAKEKYNQILDWKEDLFSKGLLNYRDSFYLAEWFMKNYPTIINLLQKRFKYVFIDEMQDLEKYQIDIIEKIFFTEKSPTVIQRIGDINQSIYNSGKKVKVQADWQVREPVMYLNNSYRLTKETADIVNFFTLDRQRDENGNPRFVVSGKRELDNPIKPHLILFDDATKNQLKSKFSELIKSFKLDKTVEGQKYNFKIIGWNAKWDDDKDHNGKLRLENIFEGYKKDKTTLKETYDSLSKYLQYFDKNKKTLEPARKAILNALIHILRIEGKMYTIIVRGKEKNKYYTQKALIKHIKEDESKYEIFKNFLFQWSFDLAAKQKYEEVYNSIKTFINSDFKEWFSFEISEKSNEFVGENFEELIRVVKKQEENQLEIINIEVETVHSVKGQTHCATMYVETSYYNYETEKKRVKEALKKEEHTFNLSNDNDKRGKQAFKMMYVGFSRPTHLLCFAVLKDNIKDEIDHYKNAGWQIIDLTGKD